MDSKQKIEERKKWNAPFLKAFNYLLEEGCLEFGISQSSLTKGELCSMMGIQAGLKESFHRYDECLGSCIRWKVEREVYAWEK